MTEANLLTDGDEFEKRTWGQLKEFFPEYENFWRQHLVPLRSEGSIHMRDGVNEDFEHLAMFHYSCYVNLVRAQCKISEKSEDFRFPEEVYACLQRAAELAVKVVERFSKIYSECLGDKPKINVASLTNLIEARLQPYRNLIHQELPASRKDAGRRQIPKPDRLPTYKRWTEILYHGQAQDFVDAEVQLTNDFRALCSAIQNVWKEMGAASRKLAANSKYINRRSSGRSIPESLSVVAPAASGTFISVSTNVLDGISFSGAPSRRKP